MFTTPGTAAPVLAADAFVRGEPRRTLKLADFRGPWVVLALGARHVDVFELAELEEAFAADGAVVIAATSADWYDTEDRYASEQTVRFPILTGIDEQRRSPRSSIRAGSCATSGSAAAPARRSPRSRRSASSSRRRSSWCLTPFGARSLGR